MKRRIGTVGVVCRDMAGGGAERATFIWARRWAGFGKRIVWFCHEPAAAAVRKRLAACGLDWPLVPLPDSDRASRAEAFRQGLLREGVDLALLPDHWHRSIFADIEVSKDAGLLVIVAEHNAFHWPLDVCDFDLMRRRNAAYRRADAITALSPANVAWWEANGFRGKVVYMPNYLSFEARPEPSDGVAGRDGGECGELVFLGRLCELKGAHLVLEAVSRAIRAKGLARAHLTFVGRFDSPEYETRLRQRVRDLGMEGRVTFAGQVEDVGPYLSRARLLVMGSRIEGAPMVLMEAKSHSVPAVLFEMPYVDGTAEGQGVVSVPYGDVDAMAEAVVRVCADDGLHGRLAAEARRSLDAFRAEKTDARWRRLLDQLSGGGERLDTGCAAVSAEWALEALLRGVANCTEPMSAFQRKAHDEGVALQVIRESRPFRALRRLARLAYGMAHRELPLWVTA